MSQSIPCQHSLKIVAQTLLRLTSPAGFILYFSIALAGSRSAAAADIDTAEIYQTIKQYHATLQDRKATLLKQASAELPQHSTHHHQMADLSSVAEHQGMKHGPLESPTKNAYELANQFIFSTVEFQNQQKKLAEAERLIADHSAPETNTLLLHLQQQNIQWLALLDKIEQSITAEKRAIQTRSDCKMFFGMKARTPVSKKGLLAFHLMDQALAARNNGQFDQALALWQKSEILVHESYNDRLAEMVKWREQTKRNEGQRRAAMKAKVEVLLKGYFVTLPGGQFTMGSTAGSSDERPAHRVTIKPFKMGKTEIPFALYDICVESAACYATPKDEQWGRDMQPVINVSYKDITKQFIPWINQLTGKKYRLPSEAEWEYAARADSSDDFALGIKLTCSVARFDGGVNSNCNAKLDAFHGPSPVKQYSANAFGLYDMHGNVWEWVQDCWHKSYQGAPSDGSPWQEQKCAARVLRGGGWDSDKNNLKFSARKNVTATRRSNNSGFRLAQDTH